MHHWIRLARFALFALGTMALAACSEVAEDQEPLDADTPEQITYDYLTTQSRGGIKEWELRGESATRYPGSPVLHLYGVRMIFYREGAKDAVLTSEQGEIDEKTQQTVARGDVLVVSESGRTLESEVLYWDPDRELIHTDVFVKFTEGDQILTGYGLETDPDLADVRILRQVEGEFPADPGASEGEQR